MNEVKSGTLYLVPTPIGNLSDMTARAISVLQEVDIIAAEDTRHTSILLRHFDIHKELISYHEHNKKDMAPKIVAVLLSGKSVAQCSDAGMPVISDPGADLVKLAIENDIPIVPLPGPNAALTALVASGLDARLFTFIGFLPKITGKKKKLIETISIMPGTLIFYEAPHRLKETLAFLFQSLGDRQVVLARELTKKFETFRRCLLSEALSHLEVETPRGEYVILVEGAGENVKPMAERNTISWQEDALRRAKEMPIKDVARQMAVEYHLSRREIYQFLLKEK